jgi:hypothetical protein
MADQAKPAAESRDTGRSRRRTVAFISGPQAAEQPKDQANAAVVEVYGDYQLTPDQASARAFQNCFEAE